MLIVKSHPELPLHGLDFTDDIALMSSSIESAEIMLQHIEEVSNCVGLHLNDEKTKTLLLNIPSSTKVKSLSGTELPWQEIHHLSRQHHKRPRSLTK